MTHASRSWADIVPSVWAYDPHPPLYYVLLKAWIGVFGAGAHPARTLSALAVLGGAAALGHTAARQQGDRVGAAAVLLFLLHPQALAASDSARMYGASMAATAGLLACSHHLFAATTAARAAAWAVAAAGSGLALTTLHAAGPLQAAVVASVALHEATRGAGGRPPHLATWLAGMAGIAPVAVLLALKASARPELHHMVDLDADGVRAVLARFLWPEAPGAAELLAASVLAAPLATRRALPAVAGLVALVAVGFGESLLGTNIWHVRLLAFATPLLVLAWASALEAGLPVAARLVPGFAGLAAMSAGAWVTVTSPTRTDAWAVAAAAVRAAAREGDLVLVPGSFELWRARWHLIGPAWTARPVVGEASWRAAWDAGSPAPFRAAFERELREPAGHPPSARALPPGTPTRVWLLGAERGPVPELAARGYLEVSTAHDGVPIARFERR